MKISFIFCVYNEYKNLVSNLKKTEDYISNQINDYEIIIIDNNSNDGSVEFLRNYYSKKIKKYFNKKNIGKGGSTKIGLENAQGEYIIIHDIDGEYDISDCFVCYNTALKTTSDLVIGSRISKRNFIYKYNFYGVILLTKLINFLYFSKLTDVASMPKLFVKNFISKINLYSNGFDLDFELITKSLLAGGKITQVDVNYNPRSIEEGKKIRPIKDGLSCLIRILKDRLVSKRRIYK